MKRDPSIDVLKLLAVLFVVNSHLDICYPDQYKLLATGGSLGDALFFFCSGFTLFLGRCDGFSNWYKRRLARIMPSTLICVLAYACWYGRGWYGAVGGYWFIRCILIYYVALFLIRKYLSSCIWVAFVGVGAACCVWWIVWVNPRDSIYAGGYFMWCHYFLPMLLGAVVGLHREKMHFRPLLDFVALGISVAAYFVFWKGAFRHAGCEWLQLVSIPFLSASMLFLYRVANASCVLRIMNCRLGAAVTIVGGLCLEVYLSHRVFLSDRWNYLFPANILLVFVGIIIVAYVTRCVSRFMVQTFNGLDGYDWYEIVKMR